MKVVVVITDSEAVKHYEKACLAHTGHGFTVIPGALGSGRSGVHFGDRVHPGGASILFTVVPEADLSRTLAALRAARDEHGLAELTKLYTLDAEEVA